MRGSWGRGAEDAGDCWDVSWDRASFGQVGRNNGLCIGVEQGIILTQKDRVPTFDSMCARRTKTRYNNVMWLDEEV